VLSHQQVTDGQTYTTAYTYNLSGALIEETYPSGRVVKNTLDNDGELMQVQSRKLNDTFKNYANSFNYTAAGAVSAMRLGNGKWENTVFNARLQPTQIGLGSSATDTGLLKLNYDYGTTDNNGNVKSQQISFQGLAQPFVQTYTYDSLNRLKSATETQNGTQNWKQTFIFDRFGNRRFDETNGNTTTLATGCATAICNPEINATNNRLIGTTFDSAGNTTADASGQTFVYDAENKQVQVSNASGIVGKYFYDGDGKRIKKEVPSTGETTIFVYDASGKLVAEYSTQVEPTATAKVSYLTNDHLGSPRILTNQNGQVISRRDFLPYGEEINAGIGGRNPAQGYFGVDSIRQKFTGYERDTETDLDFAEARYYNFNHGRFTGVDPLLSSALPDAPQTWNRYAYVLNNPLYYTDPSGMYVCKGNKDQCEQFANRLSEAKENLKKIEEKYGKDSKQYKKAEASINSYGEDETGKKTNNGVFITFSGKNGNGAKTSGTFDNKTKKLVGNVTVRFDKDALDSDSSQALVAHEGSHVNDYKTVGLRADYIEEYDAHQVQSLFVEAQYPESSYHFTAKDGTKYDIWNKSWEGVDKETLRSKAINDWLAVPKTNGGYGLKPPPPPKPKQPNTRQRRKRG
jgi:RHS repeat-associated protein